MSKYYIILYIYLIFYCIFDFLDLAGAVSPPDCGQLFDVLLLNPQQLQQQQQHTHKPSVFSRQADIWVRLMLSVWSTGIGIKNILPVNQEKLMRQLCDLPSAPSDQSTSLSHYCLACLHWLRKDSVMKSDIMELQFKNSISKFPIFTFISDIEHFCPP